MTGFLLLGRCPNQPCVHGHFAPTASSLEVWVTFNKDKGLNGHLDWLPTHALIMFLNLLLLPQHKFLRVEQGPGHIFQRLPLVRCLFQQCHRPGQFLFRWRSGQRSPVQFFDRFAR